MADERAVVEALYTALVAGDADGVRAVLDDDFIGLVTDGMPLDLGGEYAGPEAMLRDVWWRIGRMVPATPVPERFHTLDDGQLLVLGHYRFTGSPDAAFAHLVRVADGRIHRLEQLTDSHRWHQACDQWPSAVRCEIDGGVARITLDQPEHRNAIDVAFVADFGAAVQQCVDAHGLRAVLVDASGPAFTVGGDAKLFAGTEPARLSSLLRWMTSRYHHSLQQLFELEVPVVAAVHGAVAGGGLGIVHVADLVLAADDTKFALGFARLGLSGDGGSSWFLPRLVGLRRATEAFLEDRVLTAGEAVEWGLANRVVPIDALAAEAASLATRLAGGPTRAYAEMRVLLHASAGNDLAAQLAAETRALGRTGATHDAAEGFGAFHDKRTPKFEGR